MATIDLAAINLASIDLASISLASIDFGGDGSTWRRGPDFLATDFNADFRIQDTN